MYLLKKARDEGVILKTTTAPVKRREWAGGGSVQ
jgi:hypothetical protein